MNLEDIKNWQSFPVKDVYRLALKAPWWGAGTNFKWDYEDSVGFGIDKKILENYDEVWIYYETNSGMNCYHLENTKQDIPYRDFRRGVELVIIPREICKKN